MNKHSTKTIYKLLKEDNLIKEDYSIFYKVIDSFNKELAKSVVQGYVFNYTGIGKLRVIKDIRRGKSINWAASKKYKQELIDRGEIPYDKVNSPNGKFWFIYFDDINYFKLIWTKPANLDFLPNLKHYVYTVTKDNRLMLAKALKTNPDLSIVYELRSENS